MKFVPVLSFLSVGLMVVIITQAVWQEFNLHSLKDNTEKSSSRIKSKEEAIIKVKSDIQDLKNAVGILNNKKFEVMEQKGEMLRRAADMDAKLETCHTDKVWDKHTHTCTNNKCMQLHVFVMHVFLCDIFQYAKLYKAHMLPSSAVLIT